MNKKLMLGLSIMIFIVLSSFVSADTLFSDGFESNDLATNNWTISGTGRAWTTTQWGGGGAYSGTYSAYVENTDGESILEKGITTTGYNNILFSFYAITGGMDNGEYIAADWYNGSSWINLIQIEDINQYTLYNYSLGSDANNNSNFKIRFRCSSGSNNEDCNIDNVNITGTPIDTTPPSTVTNLANQSAGSSWIYWNWTNPTDTDFNHTEVWINGTFYANVSAPINYYNATGLASNITYEIQTRTVDHSGNINTTWVNDTARTLPATQQQGPAVIITWILPEDDEEIYRQQNQISQKQTRNPITFVKNIIGNIYSMVFG